MSSITEFENSIQLLREEYKSELLTLLTILQQDNPNSKTVANQLNSVVSKGTDFFNLFERSIDEYGISNFELNQDTRNRKIEDAENIINTIIFHWTTIRQTCNKFNLICPSPSRTAYSSTQRLIKKFDPNLSQKIREEFALKNLPTNGFDDKKTHSGWEIGNRKLTITQISVGLIFILISGLILFNKETINGMQYFFIRLILSLGITLVSSALLEGMLNINWTISKSLTLKATSWIAFFILLYYMNPPAVPKM